MSSTREIFENRLRDRLFDVLKNRYLKDWDTQQIFEFSISIIRENKDQINEYLEENEITLNNVNEGIDEIINQIIIPSVRIF